MLQQYCHETLHRTERCAVDHDRAVQLVVGALVGQVEPFGQIVVHLDGSQLPLAADGVAHHEVELRTVEGRFAVFDRGFQSLLLRGTDDRLLGLLPVFVRTDVLFAVRFVAQRDLGGVVVEFQRAEDVENDVDHLLELFEQLVGAHEHVGVVLREAAHARQAVQLARLLVAVDRAELRQTDRQILVRAGFDLVDLAVVGTVHRFEQVLLALDGGMDRLERILAVFGVVARRDVQLLVADMGRDDLLVAVLLLHRAQELFQPVAQRGALGQPQRQTRSHALREGEEFQLLAQLAVVALLGLFHQGEVLVEHRLLGERDAVDARQHLTFLVAAPIGAGNRQQLDGLDRTRVGDVRAAAEVGEIAVGIERNGAVFEGLDQFDLVGVALLGELFERFGLGNLAADERLFLTGQLHHLGFDFRKVGFGDRHGRVDVVVEAVLDGRADAELDAGVERFERFGQQVRRGVPEGVLALFVLPLVELDGGIFVDGARQVDRRAVYRSRQRVSS